MTGSLSSGSSPEEWLPAVSAVRGRPLAPTTRQRYRDTVRHVSGVIGKVRLCDLRASHVERVRDRLLADGLRPQTVSDVLRVLSQALSRAEARGLVGRNPADQQLVNRPAGAPTEFTVIDRTLGARILETVTDQDPWDAAVHPRARPRAAPGRGARPSLVVRGRRRPRTGTLTAADGELHFGPPKSKAGKRDLPMPDFVARALHRHRVA